MQTYLCIIVQEYPYSKLKFCTKVYTKNLLRVIDYTVLYIFPEHVFENMKRDFGK